MDGASEVGVRVRGVGAVTALGASTDALWRGLATGTRALSGSPPSGRIDASVARLELARRAPELEPRARTQGEVLLALALVETLERAGMRASELAGPRTAVVVGSTKGTFEASQSALRGEPPARPTPEGPLAAPASFLAAITGASGPVLGVSQACASGSAAFAQGARLVTAGVVDRALVGGVEAFAPFVADGFAALHALDPRGARPFDRSRAGLSLGEGAGLALLERAAANPRGPWLRGWGSASDAQHVTAPDPVGAGLERAVRAALARGGVKASHVAIVCAHGTGTQRNDAAELAALGRTFPGARAFSIKGHVGHTLGAAGALDALAALLALEHGAAPGTAGLEDPEGAGELRWPRALEPVAGARFAVSVNAGFGGLNVALLFEAGS